MTFGEQTKPATILLDLDETLVKSIELFEVYKNRGIYLDSDHLISLESDSYLQTEFYVIFRPHLIEFI